MAEEEKKQTKRQSTDSLRVLKSRKVATSKMRRMKKQGEGRSNIQAKFRTQISGMG